MTTISDVDALLIDVKYFGNHDGWKLDERGSVAHLSIPITSNSINHDLTLSSTALVRDPVQAESCVLILERRPVQRLSFRPNHAHVNPFRAHIDRGLRGLRLPAGSSRLYPWRANRTWPRLKSDNVAVAEPVLPEPVSLAALAMFLRICNIEGEIPSPP